jgi:hypothetical protein
MRRRNATRRRVLLHDTKACHSMYVETVSARQRVPFRFRTSGCTGRALMGASAGTHDHALAASVSALVMGDAVGIFFGDLGGTSANESVGVMFGAFFGVGAGGVFIDTP